MSEERKKNASRSLSFPIFSFFLFFLLYFFLHSSVLPLNKDFSITGTNSLPNVIQAAYIFLNFQNTLFILIQFNNRYKKWT